MAKGPGSISAGELAKLRAVIKRPPRWIVTDPIDMEHILQIDPVLGKQLTAQRLEAQAEVHRIMAESTARAAKLLNK